MPRKKKVKIKEDKEVVIFDLQTEINILKRLEKLGVHESSNPLSADEALELEHICVLDQAMVLMVVAKTEPSKRLLSRCVDRKDIRKYPNFNYEEKTIGTSRYALDYLIPALELLKVSCFKDESVVFKIKKDQPITIVGHNFDIIIAPRVETT